jgi:hypothetical protein
MKKILILSIIVLSLTALVCAGPARAQTDGLEFCVDHYYPYYVKKLLIEISTSDGVPDNFNLTIDPYGKAMIPVQRKAADDTGWWRGQAPEGFKLEKIELQPRIPGFTVIGPESCQYQVIEVRKGVEECAALYRFRAHQVKLTLQADPPEATIRLKSGTRPAQSPDARCAPARSGSHNPADAKLAAKVQAALEIDEALDSFIVKVTAQGGTVYLSGLVNSAEAKQKAAAKAKAAGARSVVNNLQVESIYDGTALMDVDRPTVTIERVIGQKVLFAATVEVPEDFLRRAEWTVSREFLQKANSRRFAASAGTQHGRNAEILQDAYNDDLGNIQSITIKRSAW